MLNELLPSSTCDGTRFRSTGTFSYFFFCVERAGADRERDHHGGDGALGVRRIGLEHRQELAEAHDLVDVEHVLLEHAGDRRVDAGQLLQAGLIDVRRRQQPHLALELDRVGKLAFAVAQLVGERDADRQLAFELVGRADAGGDAGAFAPGAVRVLVVGWPFSSFRVDTSDGLIASCLIDGSMLWMNGSVAKVFRSIDAAGRDSMKRASVTYICSSSFTSFFVPSMILWTMPSLKLGNRLRNCRCDRLGARSTHRSG